MILAKLWSLSWRETSGSGLDVGDPAVVSDHIFVGLAAVVWDPESSADAPPWGALWHVCRDVEVG